MPQINRLLVSRGPALITYRGGKFFSKADITVDLSKKTKAIPSSAYGDLDEVIEGVENTLKFTPVGEFEHLAVLYPYAATLPGQSIFGTADAPLIIQPLDTTQPQITFHAAAVSKQPDLNFAATETLFGDVEFSFVGKNNTATDDANYYFTSAANALAGASPYDPDALIIQAYNLSWGAAPFDSFNSREGVKVSFSLKTSDDTADAIGVYDKIFNSLGVTATLIPSGITEADLLAAAEVQGANSVRGKKISATGNDLIITGEGVYFAMYGAGIRKSGLVYGGGDKQRLAQVEFVASRSVAAGGTLNPLFYIGTAAPV